MVTKPGRATDPRADRLAKAHQPSQLVDEDTSAKGEGMKRYWQRLKERRYNRMHTLKRFLKSRCGQPWSQVYSEIKQAISSRTEEGRSVLYLLPVETNIACVKKFDGVEVP